MDDSGTLIISGTGDMFNWNVDNISPWYGNSSIVKVVISNNTTSIGDCAFQNCVNIKSILIPESVKKIGKAAFCRCEKLEDIILPRNISYISDELFVGCKKLNGNPNQLFIGTAFLLLRPL